MGALPGKENLRLRKIKNETSFGGVLFNYLTNYFSSHTVRLLLALVYRIVFGKGLVSKMSRKEKLAEEYAQNSGKSKDAFQEIKFAYYVGYAACEQDIRVVLEKFDKLVMECLIEADLREEEPHQTVKECAEELTKWKERGE